MTIQYARKNKIAITGDLIQKNFKIKNEIMKSIEDENYNNELGTFSASNGWLDRFNKWFCIRSINLYGDSNSVDRQIYSYIFHVNQILLGNRFSGTTCVVCPSGCISCSDTQCNRCFDAQTPLNGVCSSNILSCHGGCTSCAIEFTKCYTCEDGLYWKNYQCVAYPSRFATCQSGVC